MDVPKKRLSASYQQVKSIEQKGQKSESFQWDLEKLEIMNG